MIAKTHVKTIESAMIADKLEWLMFAHQCNCNALYVHVLL